MIIENEEIQEIIHNMIIKPFQFYFIILVFLLTIIIILNIYNSVLSHKTFFYKIEK